MVLFFLFFAGVYGVVVFFLSLSSLHWPFLAKVSSGVVAL